jgi:SET domain-containing protein
VNRRWVRDANVGGNLARFINHACKPNCYSHIVGKTIWIRAARNIEAGEELTYDYYTDGEQIIQCRCRPGCTRKL